MIDTSAQEEDKFVNEFLKELNDMDDINSRFQSQMQQKENETFLKFSPGQDV